MSAPVPHLLVASALCYALPLPAHAAAADSVRRSYDLPRGDAADTLKQFTRESGRHVIYMVDKVRGVQTNAVVGEFVAREALTRMLAGSGLVASEDAATGAIVVSRPTEPSAPAAKEQPDPRDRATTSPNPIMTSRPNTLLSKTKTVGAALFALLFAQSEAQTANVDPADPKQEEALVLSPFTVTTERDTGYVATSSLAGTRIRTDLKDLANPITVVTREFMQDVNATDPVDLLVYTGNTEAGGLGGNYSGASIGSPAIFTSVTRQPQNNNRVRGLARADLTRDYFPTGVVFDGYNTSRVEINRGPNATLFGLGSPGGIINSQLIQPTLKNAATAEITVDQHGTMRGVIDVDRVLMPGRLGIRAAALDEREQFRQKFAYERDRRAYAAVHLAPFKDGVLRASFEKGAIDANRPRSDAPRDNMTRWWDPVFNKITHSPGTDEFNTIDRDLLRAPGEWFAQPAVVYESNDATAPARMMYAWNTLVGVPRVPGGNPAQGFQANMVSITKGDQWFPSPTAAANGIEHGSFYADDAIDDLSVFDWRNELLDGPNKREWEDFQVANISYDHNWKHPLAPSVSKPRTAAKRCRGASSICFPAAAAIISISTSTPRCRGATRIPTSAVPMSRATTPATPTNPSARPSGSPRTSSSTLRVTPSGCSGWAGTILRAFSTVTISTRRALPASIAPTSTGPRPRARS